MTITSYGAIMNDPSSAARAANKQALIDNLASSSHVDIPEGTLHLPADAMIQIPAGKAIYGHGRLEGQTLISGDGTIFKNTTSGEGRIVRDLAVANESTRGKLFHFALSAALGRIAFENVYFGKAMQHVYATGGFAVDWTFENCKFEDASSYSRFFDGGVSCLKDIAVNCTGTSYRHVYLSAESDAYVMNVLSVGSIYEGATNASWYILANTGDVYSADFHGCHFENNGRTSGSADIEVVVNPGRTFHALNVLGGGFYAPHAAQDTRIGIYEAGTLGRVFVSGTVVEGSKPLAPNSNKVYANAVRHIGNSPQASWKTAQYV